MHARALLLVFLSAVAGCGSTVVASENGGAGGSATTSSSGGTGGGCITPTVGQACGASDLACQPADPCCTGYEWVCTEGEWQKEGLGCACQAMMPFPCGTTTCQGGQICEDQPPGVAVPDGGTPPDSYTCVPVPSACAASPSCACIGDALPSSDPCSPKTPLVTCTEDGAGHVTLHCLGI
jgi:hypothetical protein